PLESVRAHAAEDDGRRGALHGSRPAEDRREADPLSLEGGPILGPELPHCRHRLAHEREAIREVRREEVHLLSQPAGTDTEEEPTARQPVEGRHLMGGEERIALGHETDPRTDPEPARDRRRSGEYGE